MPPFVSRFAVSSFIMIAVATTAYSEKTSLEKIIAVQQAQIVALQEKLQQASSATFAVGSVQQSFLTEKQFQGLAGSGWVLCNGQDISQKLPRATWIKVTGQLRVPNCEGKFLRTVGGESLPLGESQENATAVNKLASKAHTSVTVPLNVQVSGTLEGQLDTRGHGNSGSRWFWGNGGTGGAFSFRNSSLAEGGVHEIYPRVSGSMTGTARGGYIETVSTLTSPDNETRPVNISVNTYIKVD